MGCMEVMRLYLLAKGLLNSLCCAQTSGFDVTSRAWYLPQAAASKLLDKTTLGRLVSRGHTESWLRNHLLYRQHEILCRKKQQNGSRTPQKPWEWKMLTLAKATLLAMMALPRERGALDGLAGGHSGILRRQSFETSSESSPMISQQVQKVLASRMIIVSLLPNSIGNHAAWVGNASSGRGRSHHDRSLELL